jgi:hypothetical protein
MANLIGQVLAYLVEKFLANAARVPERDNTRTQFGEIDQPDALAVEQKADGAKCPDTQAKRDRLGTLILDQQRKATKGSSPHEQQEIRSDRIARDSLRPRGCPPLPLQAPPRVRKLSEQGASAAKTRLESFQMK